MTGPSARWKGACLAVALAWAGACEREEGDGGATPEPAKAAATKTDPGTVEPAKSEPTKSEPAKSEPAKSEPEAKEETKADRKAPEPAAGSGGGGKAPPPEPEPDNASDPSKPVVKTIAELDDIEPQVLPAPPWEHKAIASVGISPGTPPELKQLSKKRNKITDDDAWWASHGITLPKFVTPRGSKARGVPVTLPADVPLKYKRNDLLLGLDYPDSRVFVYGSGYGNERYVAVTDAKLNVLAFFDFELWAEAPATDPAERGFAQQGVHWAAVSDGVLFVSTGYNGYASYTAGKNAYVAAINLANAELLWRSEPLVSTALSNFVLREGWIISGYGFTAEDDFLFLLNAADGTVAKKITLKSGPRALVVKDDRLLVRTYNTNYEFSL
ncbi:MAG: hypothetical protein AAF721_37495 [Myxococcota bacterium]